MAVSPSLAVPDAGTMFRGANVLVDAVRDLSAARGHERINDIVRRAARRLTGADGATLVLRDGSQCHYVDEDAIAPLWKGRRFPLTSCISGWAMLNRTAVTIEDIYADDRIPHDAYRPTFVRSLAMVPIRTEQPVGAIGNYWATTHAPTEWEIHLLQSLADATAVAMENARVMADLETRVADRTRQLTGAVAELEASKDEVRRLAITDELTGLHNRRGFHLVGEQELRTARRTGSPAVLVYADLDGLKRANDDHGHAVGNQLLRATADTLRTCFRESDVLARIGGDEFCALMSRADEPASSVLDRVRAAMAAADAGPGGPPALSLGIARFSPDAPMSLDALVAVADAAMYEDKRRRRGGAR